MEENINNEELVCMEKCPHMNKIKEVKLSELTNEKIEDLANMFKVFADPTRLRIICAILNTQLCVCDLCELLNLTQSNVSHQLQILRNTKLVKYKKEGKQVFYSLNDNHVCQIISQAIDHISEENRRR